MGHPEINFGLGDFSGDISWYKEVGLNVSVDLLWAIADDLSIRFQVDE